jgi:diaminohydroxyphosphoribosylaminopyrimidine deaminase/5-amino-6-(5-phosphoribosylamino)uracil reductase
VRPPDEEVWRRLLALKEGAATDPSGLPDEARRLWDLYAPLAGASGRFVIGQLGQSLDGRIATASGHSHYINGAAALTHLHRLRALSDAVVVGIGTVLADDPQLTVRRCGGDNPARIVIDSQGRLPAAARLLSADGAPVLVIGAATATLPQVTRLDVPRTDGRYDPHAILAALTARGFRRILIEGGAHTLSAFLAAGALDRLHLAVAPLIIGSGPTGISLPDIHHLDGALRPSVTIHELGEDRLFDCAFPQVP